VALELLRQLLYEVCRHCGHYGCMREGFARVAVRGVSETVLGDFGGTGEHHDPKSLVTQNAACPTKGFHKCTPFVILRGSEVSTYSMKYIAFVF
jgi:hypothetical protein